MSENKNVNLGRIVVTKAVQHKMELDHMFAFFVKNSLGRYSKCDYGMVNRAEAQENKESLKKGGALVGAYKYLADGAEATIRIVTNSDRDMTTIMFQEEY